METINITKETKNEFEKDRFSLRMKENKIVSQEEFMQRLIKNWRENNGNVRRFKMKKQNNTLDLTSSDWKAQKRWNKVGLKISKSKLSRPEKIANTAAVINLIIPGTAGPVTSPMIIKIGQRFARHKKVKIHRRRR